MIHLFGVHLAVVRRRIVMASVFTGAALGLAGPLVGPLGCGAASLEHGDGGTTSHGDGGRDKRDATRSGDVGDADPPFDGDVDDAAQGDAEVLEAAPDGPEYVDAVVHDAAVFPIEFTPSNFDVASISIAGLRDVHVTQAMKGCVFDTDASSLTCATGPSFSIIASQVSQDGGAGNALVFAMSSLTVEAHAKVSVTGTKVAIFAVLGPVDVEGVIDASGSDELSPGQLASGVGVGADNVSDEDTNAAGGGAFCGVGGVGAGSAAGGLAYGNANLVPLVGGSSGGASDGASNAGGGIQLTSSVSITIGAAGGINVNGGGGNNDGTAGGGGASGGAILLEAPTVTVAGTLSANGGGGGDGGYDGNPSPFPSIAQASGGGMEGGGGGFGTSVDGQPGQTTGPSNLGAGGGGAGRLRLNTTSGAATLAGSSLISPATSTMCVTQGTLSS